MTRKTILFGLIPGLMLGLLGGASLASAATPDLNGGVWRALDPPQSLRTTAGKAPPLLPAAKAVYEKNLAARKAGDVSFDGTEQCLPPGLPRVLYMPGSFEFLQRPEQVVIHYEWNRLLRTVDMDVPQSKPIGPTYLGQSVGRWQNGALIIDSVGFVDTTLLDAAGLPHSSALHVIEKYKPSNDGKRMTVEITIDDPQTYSRTWDTKLELRRTPDTYLREDICLERNKVDWGTYKENVPKK